MEVVQDQTSQDPKTETDPHAHEKGALDCLQWLHNRLKATAFYPEEFQQAHAALLFIEQLALDLAKKIAPPAEDQSEQETSH